MNLLRAASVVSVLTLASRITGLVREQIVAALFGASVMTDAFNVAFRLPNLLRRLFAEGAFAQAFVPILAATRERDGDAATRTLVNAVATVLFWVLLLTSVLGVLAAPLLVWLIGAGLQRSGGFDAAVVMTRIMFPYIGFMSLVALSAGVLNTWRRFAVPAVTPVLLNLAVIGAALWFGPWFERVGVAPIYALAVGVMLGGVLQLALQVPALLRIGMLPRIGLSPAAVRAAWHSDGVRRILRLMAPAVLGVSVAQISLLINTQIATQVGPGAVSWLTYADRLMEFPTALLGVALGVVLLPQLSAAQARGDAASFSAMLDWGLRLVLLLALPCAIALLVFPSALTAVLYQRGAFSAVDVAQTVAALRGYGVGLLGLVALKVLAPGFYAKQDIRTPVKIAIGVLILTQLLNLVFVPRFGHAGLALSIGCAALVNALLLLIGLLRRGSWRPAPGWPLFLLRVLAASTLMGLLLAYAEHRLDWVALGSHELRRAGWLAAVLGAAALLYFGSLLAIGLRLRHFMRRA
ncbi:murein biosynthesis integral membrane protein MurJ [Rivibacter subsaxonicus]|uniref:Probable lipid II flippase MurJ n=1 Tax=Rivibacter subsaxonicus TaxID=457575 RepID=A0A4V2FSS2_9BURK|nr:murein biosynthesis integral membrane protein MurJ [Rivibacter subsaxonicus]RZT95365.1 putative peptidoglycan lipid II flippase [Rivibacter subsaxonicus]